MIDSIYRKPCFLKLRFIIAIVLSCNQSLLFGAVVPKDVKLATVQSIIINNGTEVQSLDPHKTSGVPESNVLIDLLEGLTTLDKNGKTIPGVATSWETKDHKTWIFHLRKDAKWSNGEPVTASDFVYSWRRLVDPNTASPYASLLETAYVKNAKLILTGKKNPSALGVEALDAHTFKVELSQPVAYFPELLSMYSLSPVYPPAVKKWGEKWTQPEHFISNGAYKLNQWIVNEKIVLKRNSYYWNNSKTVINQVTFLPITSPNTETNRYLAGGIDVTNTVPIVQINELKANLPKQFYSYPYLCSYYYEMNVSKKPFNDKRVREALNLVLNRQLIVEKILKGGQQPAYQFMPPYISHGTYQFTQPEWPQWSYAKRVAYAKKLLKEAGYSNQNPLKFSLLYNTSENHKQLAIVAASFWKTALGVQVILENQEWKTYLSNRNKGDYQMARAGWCADYNEPTSFLNYYLSSSSLNSAFYDSKSYDDLLAKAVSAKNVKDREQFYQQALNVLNTDFVQVPVYFYVRTKLVKPYVGGYSTDNPLDYQYNKNLYIKAH